MSSHDTEELRTNLARAGARAIQAMGRWLEYRAQGGSGEDPLQEVRHAFLEVVSRLAADPERLLTAGSELWEQYTRLCLETARAPAGGSGAPGTPGTDRRFRDPAWVENPFFDFVRRSYLLGSGWLQQVVGGVEGVDARTAHKARFYARQLTEALSPSNFPLLNPEVLGAALESRGHSLVTGMGTLLEDLERSQGRLAPRMTDEGSFEVGKNLAVTPGAVIFQNELFQLLQYQPATLTVHRRPLVIVPPWINKYYILDLRRENSLVRWAVEQGYTVFLLSWVNPDEKHAGVDLEDYLFQGLLPALEAIEQATGEREVSALGYCIGGTLLAAALAWMAERGDERIQSATLLTAQVDFSEPGDLAVLIDPAQLERLETRMRQRGFLEGHEMMSTFNMLRASELFWSFLVNNYLLGKEPAPLDFLYWSSDPTRLPARAHGTYLRALYLENRLVRPGTMCFNGVPLELRRIRVPLYLHACREDHIAPYRSVYRAMHHVSGPVRFVLAGSGHVAGVVNPPAARKYRHWVREGEERPPTADAWLEGAEERPGSWWTDWDAWLSRRSGGRVAARIPGEGRLRVLEDAPGRYVRVRAVPE